MEFELNKIVCTPGRMLVQITEVLGGLKRGLFHPAEDHVGKDTFRGVIVQIGPTPCKNHAFSEGVPTGWFEETSGEVPWPEGYAPFSVGDEVILPRDVPKAFSHGESRYAIVEVSEVICRTNGSDVEVVPWNPNPA